MNRRSFLFSLAGAVAFSKAAPASWTAGVATVDITPRPGIWMAGFAARKCPSEGVALPLHAKALALDDGRGGRVVLVTLDLLGVDAPMTDRIASAVRRRHGLPRAALLLNASHTHCGPVTGEMLSVAYDLTPEQRAVIRDYTRSLEEKALAVIGAAVRRFEPVRLSVGEGSAPFAANRRVQFTPDGPVDHSVPVLRVDRKAGAPLAIVFGYACHNTTLQGDFCQFHGDYAGVAQALLEARRHGATALFVAGCGADANPKPRGTLELVQQHGRTLADAVDRAIESAIPIAGRVRTAYDTADLPFAPAPDRHGWTARLGDDSVYVRRHARLMLDRLERDGRLPAAQPSPVQVWRFGDDLAPGGGGAPPLNIVALGGEVVVDYALKLKKDYAGRRIWAAGYSNDVFGYVPSLRVLEEGGYEGGGAMMYYGKPGPFARDVEDRIHEKVGELMRQVGVGPRP